MELHVGRLGPPEGQPKESFFVSKRVLSTGWDESVLATRNLVMEGAGYEVITTRDEEVFLKLLQDEHFDGAVICGSIAVEVRARLARKARARRTDVPVIVFVRTPAEAQQFLGVSDYVVEALGSPAGFLAMLRTALEHGQPTTRAS